MSTTSKDTTFIRIPATNDRSLQAWNAVDEHIIHHISENDYALNKVAIFHDRFGYLTYHNLKNKPISIDYLQSQAQAIFTNSLHNGCQQDDLDIRSIFTDISDMGDTVLLKIPKSLDLLRLYLNKISEVCTKDVRVVAGFMTRHFSTSILDIASEYFDTVEQSRAWKKSRLLLLSHPKSLDKQSIKIQKTLNYNDEQYTQYLGTFSANHIDYATQFLLEHLEISENEKSFLDIGCGNGVIGKYLLGQKKWNAAVLIDDSMLATESAKINLAGIENVDILRQYDLDTFADGEFDLIITNPPFHFEYEVDPSISIQLMKNANRILSENGRILIVSNKHLNYASQLKKWYENIKVIAQNKKYMIYEVKK